MGFTLNSSTSITAVSPAEGAGADDISVTTPLGTSVTSNTDKYTFVAPGPYTPLTPIRICDTRANNPSGLSGAAAQCNGIFNSGTTIAAGGTLTLNVAGSFGVPADATAVVLNITAVSPTGPGFLTAYPTGSAQPLASNLNYTAGEVVPNLVEVGTGTRERSRSTRGQADVVVDLEGYVAPTAAGGSGAGSTTPRRPRPGSVTPGRATPRVSVVVTPSATGDQRRDQAGGRRTLGPGAGDNRHSPRGHRGRPQRHRGEPRRRATSPSFPKGRPALHGQCELHRGPDHGQPGHRAAFDHWGPPGGDLGLFLGRRRCGGRRQRLLLGAGGIRVRSSAPKRPRCVSVTPGRGIPRA